MATSNTTPVVIPQPIAAQATSQNINVIPNGATGTNRASFQEGFPAITRMPVIENPLPTQVSGLPPKQQDFNGLFNAVSQHNFFAQNGGLYSFNQAVSDAIGGYPQGALLWAIVGGKPTAVYSLVENNTFNFLTNPEYLDGVHWAFIDAGLPTGTIITWSANDAPDGYLICNGAAISRTTYARLFNVIGTTWGAGDGNTTFNLPNITFLSNKIKGNGITLGLTNGTANGCLQTLFFADSVTDGGTAMINELGYGGNIGTQGAGGGTGAGFNTNRCVGITTDPSKSGMIVEEEFRANFCIRY